MGKIKGWKKRGDGYWEFEQSPLPEDPPSFFRESPYKSVSINKLTEISQDEHQTINPALIDAYERGNRWTVDIYGQSCPSLGFICHPFKTLKEANDFAIEFMKSHPDGYSYHEM